MRQVWLVIKESVVQLTKKIRPKWLVHKNLYGPVWEKNLDFFFSFAYFPNKLAQIENTSS